MPAGNNALNTIIDNNTIQTCNKYDTLYNMDIWLYFIIHGMTLTDRHTPSQRTPPLLPVLTHRAWHCTPGSGGWTEEGLAVLWAAHSAQPVAGDSWGGAAPSHHDAAPVLFLSPAVVTRCILFYNNQSTSLTFFTHETTQKL